jgi:Spy/CpxP family protein refolding chaperone
MKSAYELAMERLNKQAPAIKLSAAQKQEIAELESKYKAKVVEREIGLKNAIDKAAANDEFEEIGKLQQQLAHERQKLIAELEERKEAIRTGGK